MEDCALTLSRQVPIPSATRTNILPLSSIVGMRAVVLLTAVLACSGPLSAHEPERLNLIDSSAVAAFADEFFPTEMARRQIPGLVFVFVSGGEIAIATSSHFSLQPRTAR